MISSRRLAREWALRILYQCDVLVPITRDITRDLLALVEPEADATPRAVWEALYAARNVLERGIFHLDVTTTDQARLRQILDESTIRFDTIPKPFTVPHLRARANSLLRLKDAQDRADVLAERLAVGNAELERALTAKDSELVHARSALVLALARLVEARSSETGPHLLRLQKYARVLGEAAARRPAFAGRLSADYLRTVEAAAPLHDIGKVAIPDHILNKPGRLTDDERRVMQGHAAAGADTLAAVTAQFPFAVSFFHAAIDIARHHHERWDGTGYPARLAGEAIPLSARLVAIGDVYDALRSPRVYKAGMDHPTAVGQMVASHAGGHFDPDLFEVFLTAADGFDRVYAETGE